MEKVRILTKNITDADISFNCKEIIEIFLGLKYKFQTIHATSKLNKLEYKRSLLHLT